MIWKNQMTEHTTSLKRRWLYIPFAIAAVIVFAYYLLWSAGAAQMKSAVHDWVEDQRAAGLTVNHGTVTSDGFPFFLRVHIDNALISSPDGWRWQGQRLSLDALPYDLNKLIFSPRGEQILSIEGIGEWRINAADLRASIANDKARGWVFSMTIGDAAAHRIADGASASLKSLVFDLAPDASTQTTLGLNLAVNQFNAQLNGETFSLEELQSVISLSQTQLLSGDDPAAQWRYGGGEVKISGFFADVEDTKLAVTGAIHLDENDFPAGLINAEIQSPAGLARLLGKAGALSRAEAEAAAAGLSLMAFAGGGKITAPINLKDGQAQIGGVKVAELPKATGK
jgi:hypothetical protein